MGRTGQRLLFSAAASGALVCVAAELLMSAPSARAAAGQQSSCPAQPAPVISAAVPADVCIGGPGLPIRFFDDYSWRAFMALVWPADLAHRGQPDGTLPIGDLSHARVFETFKAEWELFPSGLFQPTAWDQPPSANPCNLAAVSPTDLVLASFSFSKFGNLGEAGKPPGPPLVGTLAAQNRTFVRYATGFNQIEYDQIFNQKLFLAANQHNIAFQAGAIDVKAAWMDMSGVAAPERYYTRPAWVLDPASGTCSQKLVGLIGLHIVQKTPSRPQWIWSTFEHVDNVVPVTGHGMALNSGSGIPMPQHFPLEHQWPPKVPVPQPYNVERLVPIADSTKQTNAAYQAALKGTVWANYQLVMTQWPVPSPDPSAPTVDPQQSGKPNFTFPGTGATSAFANTALETFDQTSVTTGCMNCHTATQGNTDFLWSLAVNGATIGPSVPGGRLFAATKRPRYLAQPRAADLQALFRLLRAAQTQPKKGQR